MKSIFCTTVKYGFYPLALVLTLLFIYLAVNGVLGPRGIAYGFYLGLMIACLLVLEYLLPLRAQWSMTRGSFLRRDVPMLIVNGAAIAATSTIVTMFANWVGAKPTQSMQGLPWWGEAIATILISDFIWYWVHRYSHEGRGRIGHWLWTTHVMHHLPEQVYVFMHAAGHPINGAYVRVILMLPAIGLGFSQEGIFAAAVLTGFQGLVSHFNVDIRAGWLNRVFMGTQLHRYHHSAAPLEGKNYAAVTTLWDQLFGTYDYHPEILPQALGVHDRDAYPKNEDWRALLALPFKGSRAQKRLFQSDLAIPVTVCNDKV